MDDGLLAIEIDDDNYTDAAAGDTPSLPRTYQSEEAFQAQKATYSAKNDSGTSYATLIAEVPVLQNGAESGSTPVPLNKTQARLLAFAVAELYYDADYRSAFDLCQRATEACSFDKRTRQSIQQWSNRCEAHLKPVG